MTRAVLPAGIELIQPDGTGIRAALPEVVFQNSTNKVINAKFGEISSVINLRYVGLECRLG